MNKKKLTILIAAVLVVAVVVIVLMCGKKPNNTDTDYPDSTKPSQSVTEDPTEPEKPSDEPIEADALVGDWVMDGDFSGYVNARLAETLPGFPGCATSLRVGFVFQFYDSQQYTIGFYVGDEDYENYMNALVDSLMDYLNQIGYEPDVGMSISEQALCFANETVQSAFLDFNTAKIDAYYKVDGNTIYAAAKKDKLANITGKENAENYYVCSISGDVLKIWEVRNAVLDTEILEDFKLMGWDTPWVFYKQALTGE